MKHLTDEISSRWAMFDCVMDEAVKGDHSLRTQMRLLARAADLLDLMVTTYGASQKPDKARKTRAKVVKKLHHLSEAFAEQIVPALEKKDVCLKKWQVLDEKQRDHAAREWLTDAVSMPVVPMTPEQLAALASGAVFRVSGNGLDAPWMMQTIPQGARRLRTVRHGKEQLMVPMESICEDEDRWSTYRVLRDLGIEWPMKRGQDAVQPHACMLLCAPEADEETTANVRRMLGLMPDRVVQMENVVDVGGLLHSLMQQDTLPEKLRTADFKPRVPEQLKKKHPMLNMLHDDEWMLLHPYDSAKPLLTLIQNAANDEHVQSIRVAASRMKVGSRLVEELCSAAMHGKQVQIVLEQHLPDRMAEHMAAAERLREAGCTVIEPKADHALLHMDVICIAVKEDETSCYAALSTGAFDELTDRQQADVSHLLRVEEDSALYADLQQVFAVITGEKDEPECAALHMTPFGTRQEWIRLIRREMSFALRKQPCGIRAVTPELTDAAIINVLYDASMAGVPISLAVSGACCLQPGLEKLSERISIRAYHGEIVPHGCLMECKNGGKTERYLSTTAWSAEGLDHQLGLMWRAAPAENDERLTEWLDALLTDNEASWNLHVDEYTSLRCCEEHVSCYRQLTHQDE